MEPRQPRLLDAEALWQYALRILAGRAYSIGELREKLRRRAQRAADVDEALARLKDIGYLDDRRFAEGFATARLSGDGLGPRAWPATCAAAAWRPRWPSAPSRASTRTWTRKRSSKSSFAASTAWRRARASSRPATNWRPPTAACCTPAFNPATVLGVLKRFARNPELLDSFEPPEEGDPEA